MKTLFSLFISLLLAQCVTKPSQKLSPTELAANVALEAYLWGAPLVENGRVMALNEISWLYNSKADWADKQLKTKLEKVNQKLNQKIGNYMSGNGSERDRIMFIFDGLIPMSRGMSKVTVPRATKIGGVWSVVIEGVITEGVQWNVKSKKITFQFIVINDQGKYRVKDVLIDEDGFKRSLTQWLDGVAK